MNIHCKISEASETKRFVDTMNRVSDGAITFSNWHEDQNKTDYEYGMCIDDDKVNLKNTIAVSFEPVNHRPHKWLNFEQWASQHSYVLNWNRKVRSANSIYHPYIFWQIDWESDMFDDKLNPVFFDEEKRYLLSFAGANKTAPVIARDLYIERKKFLSAAVKEFEPEDFKIFGGDWLESGYKSHAAGIVMPKSETAKYAAFSFCIENETDDNYCTGYATEKIFDALRCGAIPIYAGAPDITDFVPADCFIQYNYNPEATLELLVEEFDMKTWLAYSKRIKDYIHSDAYRKMVHPGELYQTLCKSIPH